MHIILWEFRPKPEHTIEFERTYAPDGAWAKLFKRGEGYLGTQLLRDANDSRRYLTVDRWVSAAAYAAFHARWRDEYAALDQRCAAWIEHEALLGVLNSVTDAE